MPHNLDPDQLPEVKVDSNAGWLQQALTAAQRRGLWEHPGMSVFAVVELTSKSFTGHADGEEKEPQVKLRITVAEVAQDHDQAAQVAEVMRAMMRRRKMNGTLDELGPGTRDVEAAVAEALTHHPTEVEFEAHTARTRRGSRIEQHG
ncbi:hypothetical protein ABT390_36750 [Streptomyces aurantiacus]|uniref:Uncharacterized protein n=1 Tax=Streptomyces aurantiacus JA 4570 TaxID=1286094 RepID=S3ZE02_9ACTN|nr:hypothetical protein [Streptomyces aurantiacus]EPH40884.1 hypothetical protein STRAU_6099 [Streptomyces aurantiacus JA 4570]